MSFGYLGLAVALAALLAATGWLSGSLKAERAEHEAAKAALVEEVRKGEGWKAAYEEALAAIGAHREATRACLDREEQARTALEERTEILRAAQERPRSEAEKQQVVDDATRKRAADRLNRDW